jgi:hypothetical protein
VTACEVYGPYHTFDAPTGDDGYGRRCACGEPQVYRRPTGEASKFSDVLVAAEDLQALIDGYEVLRLSALDDHYETVLDLDEVCLRLVKLLD